jgi:hypothetical protein
VSCQVAQIQHAGRRRAITAALAACATLALTPTAALAAGTGPAPGVAACAEPQFIRDELGTVGQPFSLTESVGCLPQGETWSNATIHWGDGTTSAGTIAQVSHPTTSDPATMTVTGRHAYSQPGSFQIKITVTNQAGETYEGGWHTNALINSSSSPCRVPALKGDTLTAARHALGAAHCRLGAVHRPTHHHGRLYVIAQSAPAGKRLAQGAYVALWIGAKRSGAKQATHQS